jgi:hypothetical protein
MLLDNGSCALELLNDESYFFSGPFGFDQRSDVQMLRVELFADDVQLFVGWLFSCRVIG